MQTAIIINMYENSNIMRVTWPVSRTQYEKRTNLNNFINS